MTQPTVFTPLRGVVVRSDHMRVGQRAMIQASLASVIEGGQATGLHPTLYFKRPDGAVTATGPMEEVSPGIYLGSAIVDLIGEWSAEVQVNEGNLETVLGTDRFFVGPSIVFGSQIE